MEVLQSKQELEAWAMLQRLSVTCVGLQGWQAWWKIVLNTEIRVRAPQALSVFQRLP